MTIGRGGGDARDAAGIGKREILRAALLDELARRPDQRLAQLAVVIAGLARTLFVALFLMANMDASRGFEKLASLTLLRCQRR